MRYKNFFTPISILLKISLLLIFVIISCSKDEEHNPTDKEEEIVENLSPTSFNITINKVTHDSVILEWEKSEDPEGQEIIYSIYINNVLHSKNNITLIELENLQETTEYIVKIIASDPEENERVEEISFTTPKYYHTFKIPLWQESEDMFIDLKDDYLLTSDNHMIFVGTFMDKIERDAANQEVIIYKITLDGEIVWKKLVPNLLINDMPITKIKEAEDGGFVVITIDKIIKFDRDGTREWLMELENASAFNELRDIVFIPGQGYFAVGEKSRQSLVGVEVFLLKLDLSGKTIWQKIFGESFEQRVASIVSNKDGTYTFFGFIENSGIPYDQMDGTHPEYNPDFWLVTIDGEGNKIWENTYGGFYEDEAFITQLIKTKDNGFAFLGLTFQGVNRYRSIYRISENGDLLWENISGNGTDITNSISEALDGGFYTVGHFDTGGATHSLMIQKLDADGNLNFQRKYNEFNYSIFGGWIKELDNGQLIMHFGKRALYRDLLPENIFIVKTKPGGEFDDWEF